MIFDNFDGEILKLCGLCRYLPKNLYRRYGSDLFRKKAIDNLYNHGLIKMQSNGLSCNLTAVGRKYLLKMGYEFESDAKISIKKRGYTRKLYNAEWNVLLLLAGINVFYKYPKEISGEYSGYVSSLAMRSKNNIKVLAGTRFFGILKIGDDVYIPYKIENDSDWIIPGYEKEIFLSQVSSLENIKTVRLILISETLEELWSYIHQDNECPELKHGQKRFDKALVELGSEYLLVPVGREGVMQMHILTICRYRERIISSIGCDTETKEKFYDCDGIKDGIPYIIGIDLNVERIVRALKQIERVNSKIIPKICCLPFQKSTFLKILKLYHCQKTAVSAIDKNSIYTIFPELNKTISKEPYRTKAGEYIEVNTSSKKSFDEEQQDI